MFPLCDPTSCSKHCCVGGRTAGQRHNSTVCVYPFILTLHHAAAKLRNSETAVRTQTWTTRLFSIESAVCCKGPGQNPSLLTFAACNYKVCSFHPPVSACLPKKHPSMPWGFTRGNAPCPQCGGISFGLHRLLLFCSAAFQHAATNSIRVSIVVGAICWGLLLTNSS